MSELAKTLKACAFYTRIKLLRLRKLKYQIALNKNRLKLANFYKEFTGNREVYDYMRNHNTWKDCFPEIDEEIQELVNWINKSEDNSL